MTTAIDSTVREPDVLRAVMVSVLREEGAITPESVAAAFAAVPRHQFAPDAPLKTAYDPHGTVEVKRDSHGLTISVMSAAHLQAVMLEQAAIEPGMRVLEIGSGGYNAAAIQGIVGNDGAVTTGDIDVDIVERARACLDAAGYDRVVRFTSSGSGSTSVKRARWVTAGARSSLREVA